MNKVKILCQDVTYHVEIKGKGKPLLLLHGFTGDYSTWDDVVNKLSQQYMCIIPDILGHGKSDSPKEFDRYAMEKIVADLQHILNCLDVSKVHLLGYSMGGRLALSFAVLCGNKVETLILESASPGIEAQSEREERKHQDTGLAERILYDGIEAFVEYWGNIPLFATQKNLPDDVKSKIKEQRLRNQPIGLANSLLGMGTGVQTSWWNELPMLNVPVLLLSGEYDQKFCKIARMMDEKLPNSEWKIINEVGHAIHVEDSEMFGKIVSEFLEKWRV